MDEIINSAPQSRMEEYLKSCINKTGVEGLPAPQSRIDVFLYKLAEVLSSVGSPTAAWTMENAHDNQAVLATLPEEMIVNIAWSDGSADSFHIDNCHLVLLPDMTGDFVNYIGSATAALNDSGEGKIMSVTISLSVEKESRLFDELMVRGRYVTGGSVLYDDFEDYYGSDNLEIVMYKGTPAEVITLTGIRVVDDNNLANQGIIILKDGAPVSLTDLESMSKKGAVYIQCDNQYNDDTGTIEDYTLVYEPARHSYPYPCLANSEGIRWVTYIESGANKGKARQITYLGDTHYCWSYA